MNLKIRPFKKTDLVTITNLLDHNNLPTKDILNHSIQLFVGELNKEVVGVIGIENYETAGLLRSLAVVDRFKKLKIGELLINQIFEYALLHKINNIYLLTETAHKYFEKFSFKKLDRLQVPLIITQTLEFKELCPESAVVMHKIIN